MNDNVTATQGNHIYKSRPWVLLLNLFSLVFFLVVIGIPGIAIITLIASSLDFETDYRVLTYSLLCVFTPFIVMFALAIVQMIVAVISGFFSYIKITPEGIENKIWPYRDIRSGWSEVDRLGKFFLYDVLYLKSFEITGLSLSFTWPLKHLNFIQPSIALNTYNGWPDGELANDLKRYSPQLFDNQPPIERTQAPVQGANVTGISQEQRLLAALSHASVLFMGIGLFVPLVIYVTQKKRSVFLEFQALQAFIFQLLGSFVGILFPFCLVGAIFIPGIGASISGNENVIMPYMAVMMMISLAIAMLITFGSIAYGIYGIIGAILAYQGKDFRYVIIGKQIEKRSRLPHAAQR